MASKHAEKNVDSYNVLLQLPAGELNLIHFFCSSSWMPQKTFCLSKHDVTQVSCGGLMDQVTRKRTGFSTIQTSCAKMCSEDVLEVHEMSNTTPREADVADRHLEIKQSPTLAVAEVSWCQEIKAPSSAQLLQIFSQWRGKHLPTHSVCRGGRLLSTLTEDTVRWWKNPSILNPTGTPSIQEAGYGDKGYDWLGSLSFI